MSDVVEVSAHNTPSGASLSALCSQSGNRLLLAYFTLELDVANLISYIFAIAISYKISLRIYLKHSQESDRTALR